MYGDILLSAPEFELVLIAESIIRYHNTKELYDKDGNMIPEIWTAVMAIESYKFAAQQKASGQQQWYDIGAS